MKKLKRQVGLSLVEVTIMLLVLMLLTSVLAPSIWDFVHDAQWVKVKEDCEAIGISFSRLTRDIGPCLRRHAVDKCTIGDRVDILVSDGALMTDQSGAAFASPNMNTAKWDTYTGVAAHHNWDFMADQFITNIPQYNTPFQNYPTSYPVGPLFGLGWRGAYLSPPLGPDPWGSAYYVNSGFFAVANDANHGGEGDTLRWWERDVVCLSGGPNQQIDTYYALASLYFGTERAGDDYVFVISGSMR